MSNKLIFLFIFIISQMGFAQEEISFISTGEKIVEIGKQEKTIQVDVVSIPVSEMDDKTIQFIDAYTNYNANSEVEVTANVVYEDLAQKQKFESVSGSIETGTKLSFDFKSTPLSETTIRNKKAFKNMYQEAKEVYAQTPSHQNSPSKKSNSLLEKYRNYYHGKTFIKGFSRGEMTLTISRFIYGGSVTYASIMLSPDNAVTAVMASIAALTFAAETGTIQALAKTVFTPMLGSNKFEKSAYTKIVAPIFKKLGIAGKKSVERIVSFLGKATNSKPWMYAKFWITEYGFIDVYNRVCGLVGLPTLTAGEMAIISVKGTASQGVFEEAVARKYDTQIDGAKKELEQFEKLRKSGAVHQQEVDILARRMKNLEMAAAHYFFVGSATWATATILNIMGLDVSNVVFGALAAGGVAIIVSDMAKNENTIVGKTLKAFANLKQDTKILYHTPKQHKSAMKTLMSEVYIDPITNSAKKVIHVIAATPKYIAKKAVAITRFLASPISNTKAAIKLAKANNQAKKELKLNKQYAELKEAIVGIMSDNTIVVKPSLENLITYSGIKTADNAALVDRLYLDVELSEVLPKSCEFLYL